MRRDWLWLQLRAGVGVEKGELVGAVMKARGGDSGQSCTICLGEYEDDEGGGEAIVSTQSTLHQSDAGGHGDRVAEWSVVAAGPRI